MSFPEHLSGSLHGRFVLNIKTTQGNLENFFSTIELYKSRIAGLLEREEIYKRNNLALPATQKESQPDSSSIKCNKEVFLVRKMKRILKNYNFNKQQIKKL